MRARRRRAQNSSGLSGEAKCPRNAKPSPSSRATAIATSDSGSPVASARLSTVEGPRYSRCPRSISAAAASRSIGGAPIDVRWSGSTTASGKKSSMAGRRATAHPRSPRAPQPRPRPEHRRGPVLLDQLVEPGTPILDRAKPDHGHQKVVQLVGVAGVGPALLADPLAGVGIEPAKVTGLHGQAPAELDGPAA